MGQYTYKDHGLLASEQISTTGGTTIDTVDMTAAGSAGVGGKRLVITSSGPAVVRVAIGYGAAPGDPPTSVNTVDQGTLLFAFDAGSFVEIVSDTAMTHMKLHTGAAETLQYTLIAE